MNSLQRINRQEGLALLGSMLFVTMIAVMSTAFLLIMAADMRIALSHQKGTQSHYLAETAASIASHKLSWDTTMQSSALQMLQDTTPPLDTTLTILAWTNGTDSMTVLLGYPSWYPEYKRIMWTQGFSGKGSYDQYQDVMIPSQDPRTYYSIVARNELELRDGSRVEGGEAVWLWGSEPAYMEPEIGDAFAFLSPRLLVSGDIMWGGSYIDPVWNGILEIQTNPPPVEDIFPNILISDFPPYQYQVTGDAVVYSAGTLPQDDWGGGFYGTWGSFGTPGSNPMGIWVWNYSSQGDYDGNFTFNGTIYCPNNSTSAILRFNNGNVNVNPRTHTAPDPDERYPAVVTKGKLWITGWGTRRFNGLVYAGQRFRSEPSWPDTCYVDGALIADSVQLWRRTVVTYDDRLHTLPAAPFAGGTYPTITLHRRRYLFSWWGF